MWILIVVITLLAFKWYINKFCDSVNDLEIKYFIGD